MMRPAWFFAVVLVIWTASSTDFLAASELDGRSIMEESKRRHERPVEMVRTRTLLYERGALVGERAGRQLSLRTDDGTFRDLMVFDEPARVRGVASLSWERRDAVDEQWTFLPALGKVKRVVAGGRRDFFFGTDYTNEDLRREKLSDFAYARVADAELDGRPVFVVEATPADPEVERESGYRLRRIYLDKESFVQRRVEYFHRRSGNHIKTLVAEDFEPIGDGGLRPKTSTMENLEQGTKTVFEVTARSLDPGDVDEQLFDPRSLERRLHLR